MYFFFFGSYQKVLNALKQTKNPKGKHFKKRTGKQSSDDKEIYTASETPPLTKRKRKLQEAWKDKYKWLRFDGKENKMFCEFCR